MFRPSLTHILLLVIIVIVLFRAKSLPELGGAIGKSIREFKKGYKGDAEKDKQEGKE
jgi:sec-independent protein translocase protein TatA